MQKGSRNLGEFEMLVLAATIRLGGDAYGTSIRRELKERAGRAVTVGALYATLTRLEDKGLLAARTGESTPQRGGRAKRFFDVTPLGRSRLEQSVSALHRMTEGLELTRSGAP